MLGGVCDRCRAPLDVRQSKGSDANLLGDSFVVLDPTAPQQQQRRRQSLPDLSQTLLGATGDVVLAAASMHEQLRTVSRLLELSELLHDKAPSAQCGVPLCEDCANGVLQELQRRLEDAHAEREALRAASAELYAGEPSELGADAAPTASGADVETALSAAEFEKERAAQREEEAQLRSALEEARRERLGLHEELERLKAEQQAQLEAEGARHAQINRAALQLQEAEEEALRAEQLVALCDRELSRLQQCDVLVDVFRIELEPSLPIATINGLRLGRQSGVSVEWVELNAALGQVVLLVHTLGRLHLPGGAGGEAGGGAAAGGAAGSGGVAGGGAGSGEAAGGGSAAAGGSVGSGPATYSFSGSFSQHVLLPHGSFSKVYARKEPAKVYDLFGTGRFGTNISGLFGGGRNLFERGGGQAMLLACITEVVTFALQHPPKPPPLVRDASEGAAAAAELARARSHGSGFSLRPPPVPVNEIATIGSLAGPSSANEARRLLSVLQWLLEWSRAVRSEAGP